ncbi:hypothetical protein ABBQ38_000242 [Trebouxia sp. C0009 RCD-2024]
MSGQSGSGGDGCWNEFLSGLKVMVVDDDPLCLKVVEHMLRRCSYTVTTCPNGVTALERLRDKNQHYDLVLSDVYMPDVDGFKLLEQIGLELDVPVIMMSSNGETNVVLRGVTHGAVDFLIKPVRIEELRNVWQHVVRRKRDQVKEGREGSDEDADEVTGGVRRGSGEKKRKGDRRDSNEEERDGAFKKPRVVWSVEMHQQFVNAVNQLGVDKAVPKRILDLMNVEGLTRENVASHLQKYRLYLKRVSGVSSLNGRRGSGTQPEWPPMMGPAAGMGMGPQPGLMGPMPPGMGLHGIPMGNMSNQQLMQMQLHGMDLQRIGMGLPGANHMGANGMAPVTASAGMHLGMRAAAGAAACASATFQQVQAPMAMHGMDGLSPYGSSSLLMSSSRPSHLPGIGIDASESSLMNSMMGNGLYIDQNSSQRALSPEDVETLTDPSGHVDAVGLQQHFAQQQLQSLESFHVQQPCLSVQVPVSSDTAQNTCIAVGETERRSGDESVNDYAAKPEETMDDIMRFFLKDG